jgi:L-seryl-tRNA(Ser) seleniumtransferase
MVLCGAKIVVVNTLEEYKRAFNENTVMTNHENAAEVVKIPCSSNRMPRRSRPDAIL